MQRSNRWVFDVQQWCSDAWRRKNQTDDGLRILNLAARDHLERIADGQTNNIQHFILVRLWLAFFQSGCEIAPHLLLKKPRRHKELRNFLEPFGHESELLFE